ncbi:zinc finger protein 804A [Conger conger]|uniref:zinc finger protein 804A n=1 Tax=Conger conger TaxID=82655 RepID=UPI002A5B108B|nr:zinc finger protein 804A [Conger conger]
MACYYIVISSTHLSNGHFRNIKGVFRGPLCKNGNKNLDYAEKERTMAKALEDLKANFYCKLCDKQYYKHQEFDNHINSYDHAHTQRLKELKQREFARNVASKLRKDERKQERALRRLHELAEQRREVQCAPGSGPKFRSTTVAVEGSSREAGCEENAEGSQPATALDTGAQNGASNTSSSRQVQWPYTGKAKKQMHRQKIAFSISLPKKASIRLESSAAVFCENTEEGLADRSSRQRLQAAAAELNLLSTPAVEKALNYRETIYGADTQEDLVSQENVCTQTHTTSEVSNQASPEVTSDLCALLVYSADVSSPCISPSTFPFHLNDAGIVLHMEDSQESLKCEETEKKCETVQEVGSEPRAHGTGAMEPRHPLSDPPSSNETTAATPSCVRNEVDMGSGAPLPFTKPSQPFCSVLSKDGSTVLQWPSEMLSFTRVVPSLSFSCNPLHFDFRASRNRTEQGTGGARTSETNNLTLSQKPDDGTESGGPETPLHFDKHIEQPAHDSENSPGRTDSYLPGSSGHQDLSASMGGRDDHFENDRAGCLRQLKRYGKQKQKCFRKPSKKWTHSCKRAPDKSWDRNSRREYRSHKRRRRRRREMCKGAGRYDSETEKSTNFHKQPECWDGFDSQFCSNTLQQVQPLDESKQSPQNQEENSSDASKVDTTGSGRWKAAGGINGTAGSQPPSSGNHSNGGVPQGHNKINVQDASVRQADFIESCIPLPQTEKHSTMEAQSPCCSQTLHQDCPLKRKRASLSDEGEEARQPPVACHSSAGRSDGLELLDVSESDSRICCRLERIRKRQRVSLANPSLVTDRRAVEDERAMLTVAAESITVSSAIQHPALQKTLTNVLEKEMNERPKSPDKVFCVDGGHDSCLFDSLTQGLQIEKCTGRTGGPSSAQNRAGCPRPSHHESTLTRDLRTIENMSMRSESHLESKAEISNTQDHNPPSTKANGFQQEVKVAMQQNSESMSLGKSFQHNSQSQPLKRHLGLAGQEVKLSREGLRFENASGAFLSSQQGFQHPSDTMEKHRLLQAQAQRRALRPQARFHGKLKPVLSGPPIQVPSPILHPVHLPPPMSSTSITIRHTILQHHATLLQPQPHLFSQVFPITPPSLAAEMCPPVRPAFMPPPELSVVAPTGLHPVAMTFHALPRPGVFSPILSPHPALFPLQPLF